MSKINFGPLSPGYFLFDFRNFLFSRFLGYTGDEIEYFVVTRKARDISAQLKHRDTFRTTKTPRDISAQQQKTLRDITHNKNSPGYYCCAVFSNFTFYAKNFIWLGATVRYVNRCEIFLCEAQCPLPFLFSNVLKITSKKIRLMNHTDKGPFKYHMTLFEQF